MKFFLIFYAVLVFTMSFLVTWGSVPGGLTSGYEGFTTQTATIEGQAEKFAEEGLSIGSFTAMFTNTYKVVMNMAIFRFQIAAGGGAAVGTINAFFSGIFGIISWLVFIQIVGRLLSVLPFVG